MIRLATLYLIFASFFVIPQLFADSSNGLGVGLVVLNPTGVTIKKYLHQRTEFIDGMVALPLKDGFELHLSYARNQLLIEQKGHALAVSYGAGVTIESHDSPNGDSDGSNNNDNQSNSLGLKIPAGASLALLPYQLEVFSEIGILLKSHRSSLLQFHAAFGVRYFP